MKPYTILVQLEEGKDYDDCNDIINNVTIGKEFKAGNHDSIIWEDNIYEAGTFVDHNGIPLVWVGEWIGTTHTWKVIDAGNYWTESMCEKCGEKWVSQWEDIEHYPDGGLEPLYGCNPK